MRGDLELVPVLCLQCNSCIVLNTLRRPPLTWVSVPWHLQASRCSLGCLRLMVPCPTHCGGILRRSSVLAGQDRHTEFVDARVRTTDADHLSQPGPLRGPSFPRLVLNHNFSWSSPRACHHSKRIYHTKLFLRKTLSDHDEVADRVRGLRSAARPQNRPHGPNLASKPMPSIQMFFEALSFSVFSLAANPERCSMSVSSLLPVAWYDK